MIGGTAMTFDTVLKLLEPYHPVFFKHRADSEITSVRYLGEPMGAGKINELYVGHTDNFLAFGIPERAVNLLCFGEPYVVEHDPAFAEFNCIVISPSENEPMIFNKILDEIETRDRYLQASELLLQSTLPIRRDALDLNEMMEVIYELLGNPFAISNPSGTILGHKHIFDIDAKFGNIFQSGSGVVPDFDEFSQANKDVDASTDPIFTEDMGTKTVLYKIVIANTTVAYFRLVEINRPITDSDIVMVRIICDWLSREFRKSSIYLQPKSGEIIRLLLDLLEKRRPPQVLEERMATLKFGQKKWHYLLAINYDKVDYGKTAPRNLRGTFEYKFPGSKAFISRDHIVLYLNSDNGSFFKGETMDTLRELAQLYHLQVGVGLRQNKLEHIPVAFEQALFAIHFGSSVSPDANVYEYNDYAIYHLLSQNVQAEHLIHFCHPELLQLMENDQKYNTDYVYTIYTLLLSSGKQVDAAKRLHIHRSTMLYRLEKIAEITDNLDLYNTYIVTWLYLSFAILVYLGHLDPEQYRLLG